MCSNLTLQDKNKFTCLPVEDFLPLTPNTKMCHKVETTTGKVFTTSYCVHPKNRAQAWMMMITLKLQKIDPLN